MKFKLLLVSLLSFSFIALPVMAKTAAAPVKKAAVVKKTTVKKVVNKDPDVVTGTTIPGAPKGYMTLLVKARNKYMAAAALAKRHKSAKELAAAEAAYAAALEEANAMLTPVVRTSSVSVASSTSDSEAVLPSALSTDQE